MHTAKYDLPAKPALDNTGYCIHTNLRTAAHGLHNVIELLFYGGNIAVMQAYCYTNYVGSYAAYILVFVR